MDSLFETLNPNKLANPAEEPKHRCQTITQRGNPCMRFAVPGSQVCVLHGGSIPAAKEQVDRMLLALQETAIHALEEVFATAEDKVLSEAAFKLLDRTGHGPQSTLKVEELPDLSHLTEEEVEAESRKLYEQIRERRAKAAVSSVNGNATIQ